MQYPRKRLQPRRPAPGITWAYWPHRKDLIDVAAGQSRQTTFPPTPDGTIIEFRQFH